VVAVAHGDALRERRAPAVLVRLVRDDDDARDAFRLELAGEGGDVEWRGQRLAAGGRRRIVIEDLERDRDVGGHRRADRKQTRVVIRAVPHVREDVLRVGERRMPDPRGALGAHWREDLRAGEDVGRHEVAADACDCLAALRHARRAVVRTAGAEVGHASGVGEVAAQLRRQRRPRKRLFLRAEPRGALLDAGLDVEALQPRGDHQRDLLSGQLAVRRQQPFVGAGLLVALADDARPPRVGPVVEQRADLVLHERALLLDDEDLLESERERVQSLRLERPREPQLVHADADARGGLLVDAEVFQRLPHVEVRLAGGDDAEPRPRAVVRDVVQPVRARVREHRREAQVVDAPLHRQRLVGQPQPQASGRQREVLGEAHGDARRVHAHRRRAFDRVVECLERKPRARVPRHREAVHAEVQVFLHAARHEHGNERRVEHRLALRGDGGRARHVVVTADEQHAAKRRGARRIAVQQRVARAREARPLAVPHAEHALVARVRVERHLLRAPDAHHRELFVLARLEMDVMLREEVVRLPQRLVHVVERRALETRHEARRVEAGRRIAHALHDEQSRERLNAIQVDAAALQRVLVVELDVGELHGVLRWRVTRYWTLALPPGGRG
jgi:hypothetical protein